MQAFAVIKRLRDTDERVFCLVNTTKIRLPLSISMQSRTESKSIYKAKYVTSEVRAWLVCGSNSKSTIPA